MSSEWLRYISIWIKHSIFYSFTFTLSSTLYQAYAIRVLDYGVDELGNIVFAGFCAAALGNLVAIPLLNRYRYRRVLIWKLFTSTSIISWALLGFSDLISRYMLILLLMIAQFLGAIGGLAYSDFIADFIPKEKAIKVFSQANAYTISASLVSLITSLIVFAYLGTTATGYRVCYFLALVSSLASSIFLWMMKEFKNISGLRPSARGIIAVYRGILSCASCRRYVVAISLLMFFINLPGALWNYYIIRVFNGSEIWISLNTISNTLANAFGSFVLNKVSHKLSAKKVLEISVLFMSFIPVLFLISSTLERQIALNVYSGLSWAGFNLMSNIYNLYLAGENRMYMVSLLGVTINIGSAASSRFGALIASAGLTPMQAVFIASTIGRKAVFIYIRRGVSNI